MLVKNYCKENGYFNYLAYSDKAELTKYFEKEDLINVFGCFKERQYNGKMYKNFVAKSYNKIKSINKEEISKEYKYSC